MKGKGIYISEPNSMIISKFKTVYLCVFVISYCLSYFPAALFAQGLTVNSTQLNFGTTNELSSVNRSVVISNTLSRSVEVTGIKFYNTYGAPAFSVINSNFSIAAGGSYTLDVWFSPKHNIYHNTEMVILNDGLRGSVSVDLVGQGTYSKSYYAASQNKSEEDLKTTLKTITGNGYNSLIYGPARDEMFMVIDNQRLNGQGASQNTLESIYTGALAVGYTSRTDAQNTFLFNTEHTFPQSLFASLEPMKSDIHHLFPTDDASNSNRADNPFGVVTNPSWTNGGSKSNGTIFEPRDEQKGRSARAMFYFVLRYENYSNFLNSQEAILRTWHDVFPPDVIDERRNDDIFSFQNNRNPFVDYPQFVERINSLSTFSNASQIASLDITQDTIIYGNVSASTATDFNLVLVNRGNTVVNLSQFSLSHPGILSFANGGNDTTLNSGESLGVNVRYLSSTTDSVRGWLSFQTNVSGLNFVNIPLFVNDLIFSSVNEISQNVFTIYPNPASDKIGLKFFQEIPFASIIEIRAINGSLVKRLEILDKASELMISLDDIEPGVYFLNCTNTLSGSTFHNRFVKLHR